MGLYEKEFDFGFELSKAKIKAAGAIALLVVLIIALYFVSMAFFQPRAISANLGDPVLNLKEKPFTLLNITITNITPDTARGVEVRVEAEDKQSIVIGTGEFDSEKIELIESGLNRKIHFLVMPREGIKEGNYRIRISTVINGKAFTESVVLQVFPD